MTRKLKRIAPLQLGKILGVLYGLMGLIFIPFALLGAFFAAQAPAQPHGPNPAIFGLAFGLGFALFMPVLYAFFGFVFGIIAAALYNVVAGWVGGVEVEVE